MQTFARTHARTHSEMHTHKKDKYRDTRRAHVYACMYTEKIRGHTHQDIRTKIQCINTQMPSQTDFLGSSSFVDNFIIICFGLTCEDAWISFANTQSVIFENCKSNKVLTNYNESFIKLFFVRMEIFLTRCELYRCVTPTILYFVMRYLKQKQRVISYSVFYSTCAHRVHTHVPTVYGTLCVCMRLYGP